MAEITNMFFYEKFREVPKDACKEIGAGKLKGFTDINPMWRIKMLTETFGACGFGWYIESEEHWTESLGNEVAVFCKIVLKIKHPQTSEWSAPILGIGGSKLAGKGKGEGVDDEAYKMAFTDAISIACKNLGMAANIYYAKDRTKYNSHVETPTPAKPAQTASAPAPKQKEVFDPSHPKWQEALEKMANGVGSIAALQKKYIVPASAEQAITDYLKANVKQN